MQYYLHINTVLEFWYTVAGFVAKRISWTGGSGFQKIISKISLWNEDQVSGPADKFCDIFCNYLADFTICSYDRLKKFMIGYLCLAEKFCDFSVWPTDGFGFFFLEIDKQIS